MAESIDYYYNYSQTERIVLLIDLYPLLHLQNPNPYLSTILTASQTLLLFPSLSSSLFAFKFFFSSLSPLLSSSSLHRLLHIPSTTHLSFNRPSQTLHSLSKTLNSLSNSPISTEFAISPPRASHVAGSLLQLVHDYAWDAQSENLSGRLTNFPAVRSNLVLLLSPIGRSLKCLSEFMIAGIGNELLSNVYSFCKNFHDLFGAVNDAYVNRDIHCSWIDVKFDVECNEENVEIDESVLQFGFLQNGIRNIGWGFCSTDSIILGSALIPFGLIYPMIGTSFNCLNFNDFCKPIHAQLTLEISDVSGKPLECKCCDLELLNLKELPRLMPADIMHTLEFRNSESESLEQDKRFWDHFGDRITNLHIKSVQKCNENVRTEGCSSNLILIRGHSGESGKSTKKCCSSFFADRVLEVLSSEMGQLIDRKTIPIWQILLSFLCRKGYMALVSLSKGNGDSFTGMLKPFTAHLAILSIIDDWHVMEPEFRGSVASSSKNNFPLSDQNRKKNKKHVYQDLTWISFCKAAFEFSELELEEAYFARRFSKSKKLKFLKCWMKQMKKSAYACLTIPDRSKSCQHIEREIGERLTGLTGADQESKQPIPSYFPTEPSKMQEGSCLVSCSETLEAFFSNLPKKIQDGLESKGVDLQILAERIVNLSVYWLYQRNESDNSMESQTPLVKADGSPGKIVAGNLIKLLLKEPKELKEKHKDNDPAFTASDPGSTSFVSEIIVREHELQILLRMEILWSEVAESIEASTKRKLVKQICLLLEIIQYLVEGGFHGRLSLYDYVEKTIKMRYHHVLGNVVNKIYAQMDLLPYVDENESLILLLNSEDSNHSWRDKDRYVTAETNRIHESISAEDESSQPLEHDMDSPRNVKREDHARKLSEAQERRERARRFVSFTTWVPDLQRVWAPKQPKAMRAKSESLQKQSKRKERHRGNHDIVCETPMMGKKHNGSNPSGSVSKALFQDDR